MKYLLFSIPVVVTGLVFAYYAAGQQLADALLTLTH